MGSVDPDLIVPATRDRRTQQSIDISSALASFDINANGSIANSLLQSQIPPPNDQTVSTVFLQNDLWNIQIALDNFSPPVEPFVVSNNRLVEVAIEHSIVDSAYLKGYVTISSKRIGNIVENDELNTEFVFRGDGKDEIHIDINPAAYDGAFPEDIWFTKLDFIVYDVEDLPASATDTHYKRIHFWHKPYQVLRVRSPEFSTSNSVTGPVKIQSLNNADRRMYTGDAIKEIFRLVGLEEFIDTSTWDRGSSTIFHTTATNSSAEDEIEYILKHHTSEVGDHPCLLYYNRGINKFQLISLPDFFSKAGNEHDKPGEYQIEHFWIAPTDVGYEEIPKITPINRAPLLDGTSVERDINLREYSIISETDITISDMSGNDSMLALISRPVHTYNHDKKRFILKVADHDITSIKQYFTSNYSEQLYPGKKGSPLFVLNKDKTDNNANQHSYVPLNNKSEQSLLNYGRNFVANAAIFLNLGISFNVPGSSHRHPGRFIGIEKSRMTDNKYDYKLLGQWFVTSTVFSLRRNKMINYITAVKTNTYGDLKFAEDI